ncbi:MAG TPA: cupin domain-containing protein [Sphingomicrobium sp.]|jgi:mannose-6-phosphate isomerase-like protein (cupin superfamily)|nr:cupin domain-containing protein [Sphingomicrobium sp.]
MAHKAVLVASLSLLSACASPAVGQAPATATPVPRGLAIPPGGGDKLIFCSAPEISATIKIDPPSAGSSRFSMGTGELAPRSSNSGVHRTADEIIYFVRGTGSAQIGEETVAVEPGTTLFIPEGVRHSFTNSSDEPMEFVWVFAPAGFEAGFRTRGIPAGTDCPSSG